MMSPPKAADLFKLNFDVVAICEIREAGNVLANEVCQLEEWKRNVLGMVKRIPEYETGEWGGDKEGWGFVFEIIKWQTAEVKKLQADVKRRKDQLRRLNNASATKCPKCDGYSLALADGASVCSCESKDEEEDDNPFLHPRIKLEPPTGW